MYKYFSGDWFSDNAIMVQFLDDVDFYSGSERVKMLKVKKCTLNVPYSCTLFIAPIVYSIDTVQCRRGSP